MKQYLLLIMFLPVMAFSQAPTFQNVYYTSDNIKSQALDVYIPQVVSEPTASVVYIHGGGWYAGDKSGAMAYCDSLLSKGFVIVSLNYRLVSDTVFPGQLYDIKTALRFLKANHHTYMIDTNNIGVLGTSAGGHLASLLATSFSIDSLEGYHLGNTNHTSDFKAAVTLFGPSDFTIWDELFDGSSCGKPNMINSDTSVVANLLGCNPYVCTNVAMGASPVNYINSDEPAFLIMHSKDDCTVPWQQSKILDSVLQLNNIDSRLMLREKGGHAGTAWKNAATKSFLTSFFTEILVTGNTSYCSMDSTGMVPLTDLGKGKYNGLTGGLYPDGNNNRPEMHNSAGIQIANSIFPLNEFGEPDTTGIIGFVSLGMSNTTQEWSAWVSSLDSFDFKVNPKVEFLDLAKGGVDIDRMLALDEFTSVDSAEYWDWVVETVENSVLSYEQIQVMWFKQAQRVPPDTAGHIDYLADNFAIVLRKVKEMFPNLKLVYLSSRTYGGYNAGRGTPEPFAYLNGWAVKKLIKNQIDGLDGYSFNEPSNKMPWLSWGPYFWADGKNSRSDGLTWLCTDFKDDGVHPNDTGKIKISTLMSDFFSEDETTVPWFLVAEENPVNSRFYIKKEQNLKVYPNPSSGIYTLLGLSEGAAFEVMDITGKILLKDNYYIAKPTLNLTNVEDGIFLIRSGFESVIIIKNGK